MHQAFVKLEGGWVAGFVVGREIIISSCIKPVTLEQAKRSMYVPQDILGVKIVFNKYRPYEALVITNDETIPTRVCFGRSKEAKTSPKGWLRSLLSRHLH